MLSADSVAYRGTLEGWAIEPQGTQVIGNFGCKASSVASAIDEQFFEVRLQTFRISPHRRDEIGDARVRLAKRVRSDPPWQGIEPFLRARQKTRNG